MDFLAQACKYRLELMLHKINISVFVHFNFQEIRMEALKCLGALTTLPHHVVMFH